MKRKPSEVVYVEKRYAITRIDNEEPGWYSQLLSLGFGDPTCFHRVAPKEPFSSQASLARLSDGSECEIE